MLRAMARARILLVDDSPTVLMVLEAALSEEFDVETAADGASGLDRARTLPPDLVVTDNIMPGLDGFGLLDALARDPATRGVPVIVLTSEEAAARPGASAQPAAVVTKSMDMSLLLDAVRATLAGRR